MSVAYSRGCKKKLGGIPQLPALCLRARGSFARFQQEAARSHCAANKMSTISWAKVCNMFERFSRYEGKSVRHPVPCLRLLSRAILPAWLADPASFLALAKPFLEYGSQPKTQTLHKPQKNICPCTCCVANHVHACTVHHLLMFLGVLYAWHGSPRNLEPTDSPSSCIEHSFPRRGLSYNVQENTYKDIPPWETP
jgi:hypothetical protein